MSTQHQFPMKLGIFSFFENPFAHYSPSSSCRLLGSFRCFTSWIPRTNFLCNSSASIVRKDRIRINISDYAAVYSSPFSFSPIINTQPAYWRDKIHSPLVNLCNENISRTSIVPHRHPVVLSVKFPERKSNLSLETSRAIYLKGNSPSSRSSHAKRGAI